MFLMHLLFLSLIVIPSEARAEASDSLESVEQEDQHTESNTWYVSDDGSDGSDCQTAAAPCRNLQTVLNRATDGADIYVTSDTLSLDLKVDRNKKACAVESHLRYSISSYHGNKVKVMCNIYSTVLWVVSSVKNEEQCASMATLRHFVFEGKTNFKVHGWLTLENCIINNTRVTFSLHRNDLEQIVTQQTLGNIPKHLEHHRITIRNTQIRSADDFHFHIVDTVGEIILTGCDFEESGAVVFIGEDYLYKSHIPSFFLATFKVHIDNSLFHGGGFSVVSNTMYAFGYVSFMNSTLLDTSVYQNRLGNIFFRFQDCDILTKTKRIQLGSAAYVVLQNSTVEVRKDVCIEEGCWLRVQSVPLLLKEFFIYEICVLIDCNAVEDVLKIEGCLFHGFTGGITESIIHSTIEHTEITNTVFNINQMSQHGGYFTAISPGMVSLQNVTFNASSIGSSRRAESAGTTRKQGTAVSSGTTGSPRTTRSKKAKRSPPFKLRKTGNPRTTISPGLTESAGASAFTAFSASATGSPRTAGFTTSLLKLQLQKHSLLFVENVHILCGQSQRVKYQRDEGESKLRVHFSCERACSCDSESDEGGEMLLLNETNIQETVPTCRPAEDAKRNDGGKVVVSVMFFCVSLVCLAVWVF